MSRPGWTLKKVNERIDTTFNDSGGFSAYDEV
jgi:hypothetical protein